MADAPWLNEACDGNEGDDEDDDDEVYVYIRVHTYCSGDLFL